MDTTTQLWAMPLLDMLSFAAKGLVVFVTVAASALVVFALSRRGKSSGARIEIKKINTRLRRLADAIRRTVLDAKHYKRHAKLEAKEKKAEGQEKHRNNVFVLTFKGDIMASSVENMRHEVSAILGAARDDDEVVVRLESPGGVVMGYGLAASQLVRIKEQKIKLTVCVDRVAASGGYMMACVADRILCAPFAIVGSIGVAAPVPNIHRLLEKHGVDYQDVTAGEYKRTVSFLGEITEKGREKFQEQIQETHDLFKNFIKQNRPNLDIDAVATGEYWLGTRAKEIGLVDEITTSDDYLMSRLDDANLFEVTYKRPRGLRERLTGAAATVVEQIVLRVWTRFEGLRF